MPLDREAYIAAALPIEHELKRLFPRLDARVVFDIGSCEGEDAIRYGSLFPSAVVFAVEPLPSNVRLIEANLARHRSPNVRVLPIALSDSAGRSPFFVSSGHPEGVTPSDWDYGNKSSSLFRPDRHLDVHPWISFEKEIEVETETLEGVCQTEGISQIDLVHLDVQGAELAVLKGAGPLIEQIGAIWMEVEAIPLYEGQPLKSDVERFMAAHGFRRMIDTVDSVSGDQLYFNPRLLQPKRDPLGAVARRWLRRVAKPVARPIRRAIWFLGRRTIEQLRQRRDLAVWRRAGSPVPPPSVYKQMVVGAYGRRYRLKTLVETGTYYGDMVEAQRRRFGRIISIELSRDLHRLAVDRFANARNVAVLEGDSGELLRHVLADRQEPCLFWLDGHYSEGVTARGDLETPILKELDAILSHDRRDVVLVDDARCFGQGDYPSIEGIAEMVADRRPEWSVSVADDVIRIHGLAPRRTIFDGMAFPSKSVRLT
jgi:FkbM family methyltransferase